LLRLLFLVFFFFCFKSMPFFNKNILHLLIWTLPVPTYFIWENSYCLLKQSFYTLCFEKCMTKSGYEKQKHRKRGAPLHYYTDHRLWFTYLNFEFVTYTAIGPWGVGQMLLTVTHSCRNRSRSETIFDLRSWQLS
jgi:hypothetical protein